MNVRCFGSLNGSDDCDDDDDDGRGRTALHLAALWGDAAGVRAALEMRADPLVRDAPGRTLAGRTHGRNKERGGRRDRRCARVGRGEGTGIRNGEGDGIVDLPEEGRSVAGRMMRGDVDVSGEDEYYSVV